MKTLIFLRHGHSQANEKGLLTGQLPGVLLSKKGLSQSKELVERIGRTPIDFLHVSPVERCQLTIEPWLQSKHSSTIKSFEIVDGFSEIDFGKWSGRKLTSLRRDPLWKSVQEKPASVRFPDGESFRQVQRRAVSALEEILTARGTSTHLIVSHSDTIKLVVSHLLDLPLNNFQKLEISPASFTIFNFNKKSQMVTINNMSSLAKIL